MTQTHCKLVTWARGQTERHNATCCHCIIPFEVAAVAHRDTDTPILHTIIPLVVAHRDTDTPILHTVISLVVAHRRQRYVIDMPCVNYVAESQLDNIIMLCWFGVLQPGCERRCTYISSPTI